MISRFTLLSTVLAASFVAAGSTYAQTATTSQTITLSDKLTIPGASLKPGDYTFSIEDRLADRAIVRITSQDQGKHFLLLTVPSDKLGQAGSDGLIRFSNTKGNRQVLRGWACSGCMPALEFVYPKAEAAKLTDEAAEPVLAVDPAYDKLPPNLTADDMKVVTLWLLSPERITADNKGKGLKAEKYASAARTAATQTASGNSSELAQSPAPTQQAAVSPVIIPAATPAPTSTGSNSELAQVPAPASSPAASASGPATTEVANSSRAVSTPGRSAGRLPKTASNDYLYLFLGTLLLGTGLAVRYSRRAAAAAKS